MSMKWIPLDGKKDPVFNVKMIVSVGATCFEVWLKKIETTETGKEYIFRKAEDQDYEINDATHYMIVKPPKNNQ